MQLIPTPDAKPIAGLAQMTLSKWIGKKWVRPARQGGDGRGCSYGFTPMQVFGLCVCAAVNEVYGSGAKFVRENFGRFNKIDEAAEQDFLDWVLGTTNPYSEERTAAARARGEPTGIDPLTGKLRAAMYPRFARLRSYLMEQHGKSDRKQTAQIA